MSKYDGQQMRSMAKRPDERWVNLVEVRSRKEQLHLRRQLAKAAVETLSLLQFIEASLKERLARAPALISASNTPIEAVSNTWARKSPVMGISPLTRRIRSALRLPELMAFSRRRCSSPLGLSLTFRRS